MSIATGLGREQPISQAPSNVYVVTDEDIRRSGAKDLPTILRRIPGIEVMQVTAADFNVSARGDNQLRANKMLVMVDGRSIYLDAQGEVLWKMIPVTLPEIKRIEVLKGPASVLYGFNAFDGVINIITKAPEEMKGATLQFSGGEFGTLTTSGIYAKKKGDFGYRLSAGLDQTNQWENRESLAFRSYKFNAQTDYLLTSTSKLSFMGGFSGSNNYDGPIVDTLVFSQKPQIGYTYLNYERPNFFARFWWTHLNQPFTLPSNPIIQRVFEPVPRDNDAVGNTYNFDAQHAIELGAENRLTYGLNYRHNTFTGTRIDEDSKEDRFGLYVQDEWKITPNLTSVAGVRLDLHSEINPTYSPRIALLFSPTKDHTFRIAGSMGFRPPTIDETHRRAQADTIIRNADGSIRLRIAGFLFGNRNLTPEQIISYEAGYQGWFLSHRLRVRVDAFFNHLSGLVGTRTLVAGVSSTFMNGGSSLGEGEADIYGGEAGAEYLFTPWLSGFANYSYQEFGQTLSGRVQRGMPRSKSNAGLRAEFENGLSGEALVHYVGHATYAIDPGFAAFFNAASTRPFVSPPPDTRVGSYVLVNLRGAYRFWQEAKAGREAEVAVSVFNALNDRHKEHPLGETIGSLAMGWLTVRY